MSYYVYIVQCADTTYYTGVATDVIRRVQEHNQSKRGAKYTSVRRPVHLIYIEEHSDRSSAQKREYELRKLRHDQKRELGLHGKL